MKRYLLFRWIYGILFVRAFKQIIEGRYIHPTQPEAGRFLRSDTKRIVKQTWREFDLLLPKAGLSELPTFGNRNLVFLAVLTTAGYRALLAEVGSRKYAAELVADAGWKVYALMCRLVSFPFRLTTRDSQKRINRTVRALLIFPFNAKGVPGYVVKTKEKPDAFETHWTHCPPQSFVRSLAATGKDSGELKAFYESWCMYDWAGADLIADDGQKGHYIRKKTLSKGDAVCDMCWVGQMERPPSKAATKRRPRKKSKK